MRIEKAQAQMRKLLILLLIVFTSISGFADGGFPTIQAVCRVTTMEGEQFEGFITLMTGGYDNPGSTGFYFHYDDQYNYTKLFDFNFTGYIRNNEKSIYSSYESKVFFISHALGNAYSSKKTKKIIDNSDGKHLIKRNEITQQYKMFDSIPLFQKLPYGMHLNYRTIESKTHKIAMKEVVSIDILIEPSSKWLDYIEVARKQFSIDFADSDGDYGEPLWIHELVKNPMIFELLKNDFETLN